MTPITENLTYRILQLDSVKFNVPRMTAEKSTESTELNFNCLNDNRMSVQTEKGKLKEKFTASEECDPDIKKAGQITATADSVTK